MAKILEITRKRQQGDSETGTLGFGLKSKTGNGNDLLLIDTRKTREVLNATVRRTIIRRTEEIQSEIEKILGEDIKFLEARIADNIPQNEENEEWQNPKSSLEIMGRLKQGRNLEVTHFRGATDAEDDEFKEGKLIDDSGEEEAVPEDNVNILLEKIRELRNAIQAEFTSHPEIGNVEFIRLENEEKIWKILVYFTDPETL